MKKSTITRYAVQVAIACVLFSCHKKDVPHPTVPRPVPQIALLAKVERDSWFNTSMDYNSKGQLMQVNRRSSGMSQSFNLVYNNKGQLQEMRSSDYKVVYSYDRDKIVKTAFIDLHADSANVTPQSYSALTWTGNNITELRQYAISGTEEINYARSTFDYYPDGDLKKYIAWTFNAEQNNFVRDFAEEYTYDEKRTPWPVAGPGYPLLYSPYNELGDFLPAAHNMRTQTSYWETDQPYAVRTLNYTYNGDGYPVSSVSTWDFMDPRDATIVDTLHYYYLPVK